MTTGPASPTLLMHPEGALLDAVAAAYPDLRVLRLSDEVDAPDDGPLGFVIGKPSPADSTGWRERAARASWVHFTSTGFDGLPKEWLRGRTLTTTRGSNAAVVAEYAMAAVLAATKRLPELWDVIDRPDLEASPLGSLERQSVGIIGFGGVGQGVAARLAPFGARVLVLRRTLPTTPDSRASVTEQGVEFVSTAAELVADVDHLVIAAPLTPETHGLVGAEVLAAAKPGLHVVNVGRAQIIDDDALLDAVRSGNVSRATLDVTAPEPLPVDHPFRNDPRFVVSPHIAWSGPQVESNRIDMLVRNVGRWLEGAPLGQVVSLDDGY
jgi:phosphoglycerate dehydrogenase-like enzyme